VIVPEFLLKKIYQKGTLKNNGDSVTFELKNILGPGFISGFNYVQINDKKYTEDDVIFITDGKEIKGTEVSEANPLKFRLAQKGTIKIADTTCLTDGINKIVIEIMNPEAGKVAVKFEDKI